MSIHEDMPAPEYGPVRTKSSDRGKYSSRTAIGEKPPKHPKHRHWWS